MVRAVKTRSILSKILQIDIQQLEREYEIWSTFREYKTWFIFCSTFPTFVSCDMSSYVESC